MYLNQGFAQKKLVLTNITGYKIASSICRKKYEDGGVCILLQDHYESIDSSNITAVSIEYVVEVCAKELPNDKILLVSLYWNGRQKKDFDKQIKVILNHINNKYSKLNIISGEISI